MYDPMEEIRLIWEHLLEDPDRLRKALEQLEPRTGEAQMNVYLLQDLANELEKLEEKFNGTMMEVTENGVRALQQYCK